MKRDGRYPVLPVDQTMIRKKKDIFSKRGYIHFDEFIPKEGMEKLVSTPKLVSTWQFLPLLSYYSETRKVIESGKQPNDFKTKDKKRLICYASHKDSALYGFYAKKLIEPYELILEKLNLSSAVTAFRPTNGKCNIHHAKEVFDWISKNKPCVACVYDISGFFDNLDHKILKNKICEVLSVHSLPSDYYCALKSITKFSRVDRDFAYKEFGISRHNPRANNRKRICTPKEFRERISGAKKIIKNEKEKGIPQGTPISALLSNIYMLDFDKALSQYAESNSGLYRRYCDDILLIIPEDIQAEATLTIEREIEKVKLEANPDKLGHPKFQLDPPSKDILQYLGLTYDGKNIRLRSSGIGRYYSRMRRLVNQTIASRNRSAAKSNIPPSTLPIKRTKLLKRHSYVGRRNFISYALRASKVTGSIAIKRQIARHYYALTKKLE